MSNIAILYPSCDSRTELQAKAVYRGALAVPSVHARLYTEEEAAAQSDELDVADRLERQSHGSLPHLVTLFWQKT